MISSIYSYRCTCPNIYQIDFNRPHEMAEAASQLDLEVLTEDSDDKILIPSSKKKPIYNRNPSRIYFILFIVGISSTLVRWLRNDFNPEIWPPILIVILIMVTIQRERVKGIYKLTEKGIKIPYMWFYRRTIPYDHIIKVSDDTIKNEETGQSHAAIRIIVDSPLIKLNVTGMQSPNILLSTLEYDSMDLNRFADDITRKNRENMGSPNTLAQRLTDQVNRAWKNRWLLILFNLFDAVTEFAIYLLLIESFVFGFLNASIFPNFAGILTAIYIFVVFLIHFSHKPQAIIGMRPHELGPLIYDEEELITSVRFIVMCRPNTVHLRDCEVTYPEGASKQVGRLNQIQPDFVEPGELTYGIAQIIGNHTKASGAVIKFTYKETEESRDVIYEIPLEWA